MVTRKIARRSGGGTTAERRSTTQKSLETELVQSKQRVGDVSCFLFRVFNLLNLGVLFDVLLAVVQ